MTSSTYKRKNSFSEKLLTQIASARHQSAVIRLGFMHRRTISRSQPPRSPEDGRSDAGMYGE
jgi:hypothetical protein